MPTDLSATLHALQALAVSSAERPLDKPVRKLRSFGTSVDHRF
jgi:hypothetical protein